MKIDKLLERDVKAGNVTIEDTTVSKSSRKITRTVEQDPKFRECHVCGVMDRYVCCNCQRPLCSEHAYYMTDSMKIMNTVTTQVFLVCSECKKAIKELM